MGMYLGAGRERVRADINVTPLVDVVLVLLIIFMIATPIVLNQLAASVPQTVEAPRPPPVHELVVGYRAGVVLLNAEPVTESELVSKVRAELAQRRDRTVFFDVDDDANYGDAVRLLDLVRGTGARTLALVTRN